MVMSEKRCLDCGKALPADHASAKCSLCAIGLTPPKSYTLDIQKNEDHAMVTGTSSGRVLSGVFCPHCEAEFNLVDLKRLSCSICGAEYTPEKMADLMRVAEQESAPKAKDFRDTGLGEKTWPEDAPLW